jgi:hypothetical protein
MLLFVNRFYAKVTKGCGEEDVGCALKGIYRINFIL